MDCLRDEEAPCKIGGFKNIETVALQTQKATVNAPPDAGENAVVLIGLLEVGQKAAGVAGGVSSALQGDKVGLAGELFDGAIMPSAGAVNEGVQELRDTMIGVNKKLVSIWVKVKGDCCVKLVLPWNDNYHDTEYYWFDCREVIDTENQNIDIRKRMQACKQKAIDTFDCKKAR